MYTLQDPANVINEAPAMSDALGAWGHLTLTSDVKKRFAPSSQ